MGPGSAQRQRGLEFSSDGIRYDLQRFRCVTLRSTAFPAFRARGRAM